MYDDVILVTREKIPDTWTRIFTRNVSNHKF